jgi:hypothetical protein
MQASQASGAPGSQQLQEQWEQAPYVMLCFQVWPVCAVCGAAV